MSHARFAAITSELLARKGEAQPWSVTGAMADAPARIAPPPVVLPPVVKPGVAKAPPAPPPTGPAIRKCSIRVSAHDFERLGIAAVKDDTTRQHLLQQALSRLLDEKEEQYRAACRCMAAAPCGMCD